MGPGRFTNTVFVDGKFVECFSPRGQFTGKKVYFQKNGENIISENYKLLKNDQNSEYLYNF